MDAFPLNKLSAKISITLKEKSYSNAGTISFWTFIEDSSTFGDNLFTIAFTKRLMVAVGKDIGIKAFCASNLAYYQSISGISNPDKSLQGITSLTSIKAQMVDSEKNIKEAVFGADDKDKNWFHVRCSFSMESKKQYVSLHTKDTSSDIISTPETIKLHNYVKTFETDFTFRFHDVPTLVITPITISKMILIKNLAIFADYIPNDVRYEY